MSVTPPHGELHLATAENKVRLSRLAKAGKALRLTTGIYAVGATLPPEDVASQHRFTVIGHFWPKAVVCGRSALAGAAPVDGVLYIATPDGRLAPLALPGFVIQPVRGPAPLPGDTELPGGIYLSGAVRTFIENIVVGRGRPARHRAGTAPVEDRIDGDARFGGAGRIRMLLDQLDVISGSFDPVAVDAVRSRLRAVLGTFDPGASERIASPLLAGRLGGQPYDGHRMALLENLIEVLTARPPTPRPAIGTPARWEWLAFFEAYFSNFIEGTEFGVDEARRIAIDGIPFAGRLEDAHDVAATFRLAADSSDRTRVPGSGEDLIDILRHRHRVLMAARADKRPGELKTRPNFAGGYEFVSPDLVPGTLIRGFSTLARLHDPLARAVAVMALVTECHPFDDGNGRVARLTANAELSAAGEVRIVIPTVYRNNYLAGLGALSNGTGKGEPLVAVLEYAQRWTQAIDWSDYDAANRILTECYAFDDPVQAEASGRRLRMPG